VKFAWVAARRRKLSGGADPEQERGFFATTVLGAASYEEAEEFRQFLLCRRRNSSCRCIFSVPHFFLLFGRPPNAGRPAIAKHSLFAPHAGTQFPGNAVSGFVKDYCWFAVLDAQGSAMARRRVSPRLFAPSPAKKSKSSTKSNSSSSVLSSSFLLVHSLKRKRGIEPGSGWTRESARNQECDMGPQTKSCQREANGFPDLKPAAQRSPRPGASTTADSRPLLQAPLPSSPARGPRQIFRIVLVVADQRFCEMSRSA